MVLKFTTTILKSLPDDTSRFESVNLNEAETILFYNVTEHYKL